MKNTIRVRKNDSAAPSARQVKTPPGKTVTVIFYSPDNHEELMRVDFEEPFFAAIKRAAKKLGVGLDKFFEFAIESKIALAAAGGVTGGGQ
jgi:hypothetical protein